MPEKLHLIIVTQDQELLNEEVDSVSAPTTQGEITILAQHIPLFAKLDVGELVYRIGKEEHSVVISKGFLDMQPGNKLQIIVDSAVHERAISVDQAEAAVKAAQETMALPSLNQRELILAEGSLRRALLEIKVAQRTKKATVV